MKKTLLTLSLAFIFSFSHSQEKESKIIRLVGKLENKITREPIPFANIGVVGSYIGAASNFDGFFEVKIPRKYANKEIQVSAVGFGTYTKNIAECEKADTLFISLIPKNYNINEIKIEAESLVLLKTIKNAVDRIPENYIQQAFNYDIYYRSEKLVNDSLNRLRESAARIYDSKGYKRDNAYSVYKQRGYKFLQVRRNFESNSLADGSTYLDELMEMDIVRQRGNILNKNHLNFYDLKLEEISEYENDSIWVISYKSKRPILSNTGDYYSTKYEGKIYIKLKDFAVIKNETKVTASNYSPQGRSFYINEKRQKEEPLSITYNFSTTYKKHNNKYYLSYVSCKRKHKLKNKETGIEREVEMNSEMLINKIEIDNPEVITNRMYYENIPFNKNFWNSYNILVDRKEGI